MNIGSSTSKDTNKAKIPFEANQGDPNSANSNYNRSSPLTRNSSDVGSKNFGDL